MHAIADSARRFGAQIPRSVLGSRQWRKKPAATTHLENRILEALAEPPKPHTLKQFKAQMRKIAHTKAKLPPSATKPPRCRHVLVILDNKLEIVELIREDTFPVPGGAGDFADGPMTFAVMRFKSSRFPDGIEVQVPLECVVFLVGGFHDLEIASRIVDAAGTAIETCKKGLTAKRAKRG